MNNETFDLSKLSNEGQAFAAAAFRALRRGDLTNETFERFIHEASNIEMHLRKDSSFTVPADGPLTFEKDA